MWPFNLFKKKTKPAPVPEKDQPMELVLSRKETHEIGRTLVRVTFLDGKKFDTWYYGTLSQYVSHASLISDRPRRKWSKPIVWAATIESSLSAARRFIVLSQQYPLSVTDDPENAMKSYNGFPVAAKIIRTESFEKEFDVSYLPEEDRPDALPISGAGER